MELNGDIHYKSEIQKMASLPRLEFNIILMGDQFNMAELK